MRDIIVIKKRMFILATRLFSTFLKNGFLLYLSYALKKNSSEKIKIMTEKTITIKKSLKKN